MLSVRPDLFVLLLLVCLTACTTARADYRPPIINESDFGAADTWLGFQADQSEVRTAPEYADWARLPGGMETDAHRVYAGKPSLPGALRVSTSSPSLVSNTRTVPSTAAAATRAPSGLNSAFP